MKAWRSARAIIGLTVALAPIALGAAPAAAQTPWWHLASRAAPTNLPPEGEGKIIVTATNLGDAEVNGAATPVTITDTLPQGTTATATSGAGGLFSGEMECAQPAGPCTFTGTLPPYERLQLEITVKVQPNAPSHGTNTVAVEGGGAPSDSAASAITVDSSPTPFGIKGLELIPELDGGGLDSQAGSHPFQLTSTITFNQTDNPLKPPALPKDLNVHLPPGLVGNPTAFPQCADTQFARTFNFVNACPTSTAIGVADVTIVEPHFLGPEPVTVPVPVFNLKPAAGEPARFGFEAIEVPVILDTAVRSGGDYGVTVDVHNIPQVAAFISSVVILWGAPGDKRHDQSRGWNCIDGGFWTFATEESCIPSGQPQPSPFLTLPTSCTGPLETTAEADSWTDPGNFGARSEYQLPQDSGGHIFGLGGCERLAFDPSIEVTPDGQSASTPTGLAVGIHVPQETTLTATGLAEADVKDTTLTLPEGVQINPASADGLDACSEAQVGFAGFAAQTALFSADAVACPDAAKIGTVEIKTRLLPNPLLGGVYLASQNMNPFGSLLALYLVAEDRSSGVLVKLAGRVSLDPTTGRLTSTFENTPQLPFEDVKVRLFGGPRAPLSTPAFCGAYSTNASFRPWSGTPPATPSSGFEVKTGPHGSACANPLPFTPSLTAGSRNIQAGAFSPFVVTMSREDGNQNLGGIQLHMPPGLLGKLSAVTPCPEPKASQGTCGPESLIGHTVVSAGLGSNPYTVPGGQVFITGPYKGAPYGLSVAQPAKAGPFDVGGGPCDCVVVRAKIEIDPHTSALTVVSDPLPTILQGIPLQIKNVNVTVDRQGFVFNPTRCAQLPIGALLSSELGTIARLSVPFEAANCVALPFKPTFTALTQARTSKANGASLQVKVTSGPGQANIGKVKVDLPKQLPSRLTTLQKACQDVIFNANPASCPAGSVVGTATAVTPILKSPLTGPAYLVSHAAAAFPDLVIVLQGEGITLDLVGNTDIKKGITSSTFNAVPDAPVSTFDLVLPEGPHSALAANDNLCKTRLNMPTAITGQNGAVIKQRTRIAVSGCPRPTVKVKQARVKGNTVLLTVTTTQSGTVTVSGRGLKTTKKTLGAGTHPINVSLTSVGETARKHHKKTKLKVTAKNTHGSASKTISIKL
jgi:hypothetical protein